MSCTATATPGSQKVADALADALIPTADQKSDAAMRHRHRPRHRDTWIGSDVQLADGRQRRAAISNRVPVNLDRDPSRTERYFNLVYEALG